MTATIDSLVEKCNNVEEEFTQYLGFRLPKKMTRETAMQFLTAINEPLKSDIKRRMITRDYAISDYDYRWIFFNSIIKFSVRFGSLETYIKTLQEHFVSAFEELEIRLHGMLTSGNFSPSQFPYLRGVLDVLEYNLDQYVMSYEPGLITVDNFINLAPTYAFKESENDLLVSMSERLGKLAKKCVAGGEVGYDDPIGIYSGLRYIETKEDLERYKSTLCRYARFISVFNEILNTKF